jgi:hypothetical protein
MLSFAITISQPETSGATLGSATEDRRAKLKDSAVNAFYESGVPYGS